MLTPATIEAIGALMARAGLTEVNLREQFVLGSGSGGQKINKTSSAVRLTHEQSGAATELPVTGLFICIGRMADNAPFDNLVVLDPQGFILAGEDCRTNVPGLFAAGDCRAKAVRQLTTAAADGAIAATAACRYIG